MLSKLAKQSGEVTELMMGIEPACIREKPDMRRPDHLGLYSDHGVGSLKSESIGTEPNDRKVGGTEALDLSTEERGSLQKLCLRELIGGRYGSCCDVGDTQSELSELAILSRLKEARREARGIQCRPEPIPGSREVMTDSSAVEPGIDSAEQDLEVGSDDVAKPVVSSFLKLLPCGTMGMFHVERLGVRPVN